MLVAAAVCPHPPLLVPGAGAGAAGELDDLRAACERAVGDLVGVDADLLVVVGDAPAVGPYPDGAWGSLRPYGVPADVPAGPGQPTLPLSLTLGRWLVDRAGGPASLLLFGVSADSSGARCRQLGRTLAERAPRVSLLAMGDGSARRSVKGPGYLDERAEPFAAAVATALREGDVDAIAGLDADLARELLAAGRAPWQVMAGAAGDGEPWRGEVTYDAAPYGVTYLVASWCPA
ncbi:MAG: class III extradiol dioxygenase subunit B-like domain-containing protein [Actinomycetes bacterium]